MCSLMSRQESKQALKFECNVMAKGFDWDFTHRPVLIGDEHVTFLPCNIKVLIISYETELVFPLKSVLVLD